MRAALFLHVFLLAAAGFLLAVCFSCGSRREVVSRQRVDSVAVTAVKADHVAMAAASWEFIREIVVLQADSVGELRPVLRVVERQQGKTDEKIEENVQKTDSAAFSVQSEVITKEMTEKPLEAKKTRFWRNAFFWLFGLAATVTAIVLLWRKTLKKWI